MNVICLIGRLTREPELRYTTSNIPVCRFTIAVDRKYAGEGQQKTDFINCVAWRSTAEFVSKYFDKGVRIGVTGSLQINTWENEEGKKMYSAEVLVNSIDFADGKKDVSTSAQPKVKVNKSEDEPQFIVLDDGDWDDIPF
ncbi:MAG TPA: single-stranded DNA-binding protein [Clostridia bacterium]|nr:single-stranded DNA-binding protein [Clostridia bacterium]